MELTRNAFWGYATALCVLAGGALMGAAIGSSPVLPQRGHEFALPQSEPLIGDYRGDRGERPPDHYPLVTPEGTVPVAELALRGRLRNERRGWWDEPDRVALGADYPGNLADEEIDRLAEWDPRPNRRPAQSQLATVHVRTPHGIRIETVRKPSPERTGKREKTTAPAAPVKALAETEESIAPAAEAEDEVAIEIPPAPALASAERR